MQINIRVYGILINANKEVLVSDEYIRGLYVTKFPGGGLEVGEGTIDCLKREFREETGLDVKVGKHFYTTDFFQISGFNTQFQIISIYYLVHCTDISSLKINEEPFQFPENIVLDSNTQAEVFRFVPLHIINSSMFKLPIDKVVVDQLITQNL